MLSNKHTFTCTNVCRGSFNRRAVNSGHAPNLGYWSYNHSDIHTHQQPYFDWVPGWPFVFNVYYNIDMMVHSYRHPYSDSAVPESCLGLCLLLRKVYKRLILVYQAHTNQSVLWTRTILQCIRETGNPKWNTILGKWLLPYNDTI